MSSLDSSCRRPEEALLWSNHGVQPWGPRHCGPGGFLCRTGLADNISDLCPQASQTTAVGAGDLGEMPAILGRGGQPASDPHLRVQVWWNPWGPCLLSSGLGACL